MASLTGTKIKDTYDGLLKVTDNVGINSTKKIITDGLGNNSSVKISSEDFEVGGFFFIDIDGNVPDSKIGIGTNSPTETLHVVGDFRLTARFFDGSNSAGTSGRVLMSTGSATSWSNTFTTAMTFDAGVILNAGIKDYTGATGTAGQVLSSTGSDVEWVSLSEIQGVDGSGTANYIPIWTDSDTLGNSVIYQSSSNIGIGTLSPGSYKLNVFGDFKLDSNGSGYMQSDYGDHRISIFDLNDNEVISFKDLDSNSANQLVVASTGVGINVANPSEKLHVSGEVLFSGTGVRTTKTVGTDSSLEVQNGISIFRTTNTVGWLLDSNSSNHLGLYNWNRNGYVLKIEDNTPAGTVYINASGYIGIATTSPTYKLHVVSGVTPMAKFEGTTNAYVDFTDPSSSVRLQNSGHSYFGTQTNTDLNFKTNATVKMTIQNGGNIGIGTTSPDKKLDVTVDTSDDGVILQTTSGRKALELIVDNGSNGQGTINFYTGTSLLYGRINADSEGLNFDTIANRHTIFKRAGSETMRIDTSSRVGIGTSSPIEKLHVFNAGFPQLNLESNGGSWQLGVSSGNEFVLRKGSSGSDYAIWVESNLNVGIGTTSPGEKLHVFNAGTAMIKVDSGATSPYKAGIEFLRSSINGGRIYNDGSAVQVKLESDFGYDSNNPTRGGFMFKTAPVTSGTLVDAVRIDALGNVGIGNISPDKKLRVDGDIKAAGDFIGSGLTLGFAGTASIITNDTNENLLINPNGTGKVGIGTTSPNDKLEIADTTAPNIRMYRSGTGQVWQQTIDSSGRYMLREAASSGGTLYTRFQVDDTGEVALPSYGSGTFTGTATQRLAVDSSGNIIELPIGSGAVDGSGAANKLAIWSDTDTLTSNVNISVVSGELQLGNGLLVEDNDTSVITAKAYEPHIIWQKTRGSGGDDYFKIKHENDASAVDFSLAQNGGSDVRIMRINNNNRVIVGGYNEYNASTLNVEGTFGVSTTSKFGGNAIFVSKIGIGTTSPTATLHVETADDTIAKFKSTDNKAAISISDDDTTGYFSAENGRVGFGTGLGASSSNISILTSNSNVGIGTVTPQEKLHVMGTIKVSNNGIFGSGGTGSTDAIVSIDGGSDTGGEAYLRLMRGGVAGFILNHTANQIQVRATANIPMFFYTNDTIGIKLNANSSVSFPLYGSGTFTGTATYRLAVDSSGNIIEIPIGSGAVDGSGTANTVTMWSDADTLTDAPITISSNDATFAGDILVNTDTGSYIQIDKSDGSLKFADNNKAKFGTGNDLSIYHTGSLSYINQSGTGKLIIQAENTGINIQSGTGETRFTKSGVNSEVKVDDSSQNNKIVLKANGNSYLNGGNVGIGTTSPAEKLEVAGNITATGSGNTALSVISTGGYSQLITQASDSDSAYIFFKDTSGERARLYSSTSNDLIFKTNGGNTTALTLHNSANATFSGDITTDGSINVNRLAGGTPYDNFKISTADIVTTLERVENTGDANAGYGRLDFKTNAATGHSNSGRGGFKFIDGSDNSILYLDNKDKNATFGGSVTTTDTAGIIIDTTGNALLTIDGASGSTEAIIFKHAGTEVSRISHSNSTNLVFSTGSSVTTALTLDTSQNATFAGNITMPDYIVHTGDADTKIGFNIDDTVEIRCGGNLQINADASRSYLRFQGAAKLYTDTLGVIIPDKLGIGTTSPAEKLHIQGSANGNVKALIENTNTGTNAYATLGFQSDENHSVNPGLFLNGANNSNYAGASSLNMYQYGNFPLGFVTSNTIRMTVTGAGNVGIGTTSPASKLHLYDGDFRITGVFPRIYLQDSNNDSDFSIINGNGNLRFYDDTNASDRLYISASGNVGIGTTSPSEKLSISGGNIAVANGSSIMIGGSIGDTKIGKLYNVSGVLSLDGDGTRNIRLGSTTNGEVVRIDNTNGRVGIGTTSPSEKLEVNGSIKLGSMKLQNLSAGGRIGFNRNTSNGAIYNSSYEAFQIQSNGAGYLETQAYNSSGGYIGSMFFTDTARLGIGTSSPGEKLEVDGSIKLTQFAYDIYFGGTANYLSYNLWNSSASGGMGIKNQASASTGHIYFSTSTGEKVRILRDGSVGIGTTSPSYKLDVNGELRSKTHWVDLSATTQRAITSTGTDSIQFGDAGVNDLRFKNASGVSLDIKSTGKVGIGTTAPTQMLHVLGGDENTMKLDASTGQPALFFAQSGANRWEMRADSSHYGLYSYGTSTWEFYILNGNTGIGTTSPSEKLHVSTSNNTVAKFESTDANANIRIGDTVDNTHIGTDGGKTYIGADTSVGGNNLTILSDGKVGIGTGSPDSKLEIYSDSVTDFLKLTSGGSSANPIKLIFEKGSSEQGIIEYNRNGDLEIYNTDNDGGVMIDGSSSEGADFYVNNSGNVGIGTSSPTTKLDISDSNPFITIQGTSASYVNGGIQFISKHASTARGLGNFYYCENSDVEWFSGLPYNNNDAFVINRNTGYTVPSSSSSPPGIGASAGTKFIIDSSGKVGIGTTSPSHKLNIVTANDTTALGIDIGSNAHFDFSANSTSSYTANFNIDDTGLDIGHNSTSRALNLKTGNSDRLTILGTGNVGIGTTSPSYKLDVSGSLRATGESTFTNNLLFSDTSRIKLGTGQDLQIYHDGSHSYIEDTGTGQLRLKSNSHIQFLSDTNDYHARMIKDQGVELYYDNSKKFETTNTGIAVTGTIASRNIPVLIHTGWGDDTSTTSNLIIPLSNSINETTVSAADGQHFFIAPSNMKVIKVIMKNVSGSVSSSFTTQFKLYKNGSESTTSSEIAQSTNAITWEPTTGNSFVEGDELSLIYQKSATSKYWREVSLTIVLELIHDI